MKESPIFFTGAMVHAILAGRKSQARRVLDPQPPQHVGDVEPLDGCPGEWFHWLGEGERSASFACPYGVPGDRLWVREKWALMAVHGQTVEIAHARRVPPGKTLADSGGGVEFVPVDPKIARWAAQRIDEKRWRPARFMPRWASSITLELTGVRVERLQNISPKDAIAEGIPRRARSGAYRWPVNAFEDYSKLWDSINAKRAPWKSNPWVWVVEFKRV